ncbi:hypothetical protein FQN54_009058 [Arachnomyces sp. PD_36]|nr:hypothetical protein FQN54_009058 [Arachnomyces sp. PD_36]
MRFTASLFGLAACSLLSVSHATRAGVCGAEPSEDILAAAQQLRLEEIDNAFESSRAQAKRLDIQTYFHVLSQTQEELDKVTDKALQEQIDVMNQAFGRHNIWFNLAGTSREVSILGASAYTYPSDLYTYRLHKGQYDDLNVYVMSSLGEFPGEGTLLGVAQFPKEVSPRSPAFYRDGVAIISSVLPGGSFPNNGGGLTLVHEAGHWLGLFHTFQDGCGGQGDQVDDTPAQADASPEDCSPKRDSCPNDPGNDPVHNYMDYSSEACQTEFTNGQITRIFSMWKRFRA